MWGVRVTVVQALSLTEIRIDHDKSMHDADFVVCYNELHDRGHFSAVCKYETRTYARNQLFSARISTKRQYLVKAILMRI